MHSGNNSDFAAMTDFKCLWKLPWRKCCKLCLSQLYHAFHQLQLFGYLKNADLHPILKICSFRIWMDRFCGKIPWKTGTKISVDSPVKLATPSFQVSLNNRTSRWGFGLDEVNRSHPDFHRHFNYFFSKLFKLGWAQPTFIFSLTQS